MKTNLYKETTEKEREQIKEQLKKMLEEANRTIYQAVTKVSNSGMSRHLKNFIPVFDENRKVSIISIDWYICKLLENTRRSDDGVFIEGCGMDMGFSIAYDLGRALYPNGDGVTITGRNGSKEAETDGGYLIKQVWI